MKSILITGCNRGLGLGLVKNLLKSKHKPEKLIATYRDLSKSEELHKIASANENVHLLKLDVKQTETFDKFAREVQKIVGEEGLNVLFNNAGCSPKFTRLGMVKTEQLVDTLLTNTVAPIMLTKALLPLLKQAALLNVNNPIGIQRATVINMTSLLGSVEMNKEGGLYPYRCSKSALNMATKSMSVDLLKEGILVTCIHPGWVKTDMGGSNAPLDINTSTNSIIKLLGNLNEKSNGKFYQFDGNTLPW